MVYMKCRYFLQFSQEEITCWFMVNICHFEVYTETIQSRPCALKNQNNETPVYSSTKGHFGGIVVVIHDVQFFVTFHA